MIDPVQLRDCVVRPVLEHLAPEIPYSLAAEQLLLGTAAQESRMTYLKQLGKGPAVGIWQMEPFTHDDLWRTTLLGASNPLAIKVRQLELPNWWAKDAREMVGNLFYACAMARVFYRRIQAPLPAAGDVPAMAAYWKRYYNTAHGKGTVEEFCRSWNLIIPALTS